MQHYLDIDHVGITFPTDNGPLQVLDGVNLKVAKGEFISLIGHSGCGKSTVLNIVAGLVQPTEGGVVLEGREVKEPGPDRAVVFGATARVLTAITGTGVTGWRLGVSGATDRYGAGVGLAQGSSLNGVTGAPVGYFADTPLVIDAEGGDFAGGSVRLCLHYMILTPPDAV